MVDRKEVDQMAKFMQALSGSPGGDVSVPPGSTATPTVTGDNSVAEMKAILERFHGAAGNVISEAPIDRPLREALAMERTDFGVRVGNWEIVVNQSGKQKMYDVINVITSERIATDLMIYEAASALARHLNDSGSINKTEVVEMLRAEGQYAAAVNDLILYRRHLTKAPNSSRAGIFEARYGAAQRKAVVARDRVKKLSESL